MSSPFGKSMSIFNRIPSAPKPESELALRAANEARSEPRLLPNPIRTNVSEKRIGPASWPVARPSVLRYAKRSAKGSNGGSRRFAASSYSAVRQNSGIPMEPIDRKPRAHEGEANWPSRGPHQVIRRPRRRESAVSWPYAPLFGRTAEFQWNQ